MRSRIKEARDRAGFSQKELADRIGVAQNTFHGYESGKHDPKSEVLAKIADACGVTVDFLLGRSLPEDGTKAVPPWGEGTEKLPALSDEELLDRELIGRLCSLSPEELQKVDAFVQGLLAAR